MTDSDSAPAEPVPVDSVPAPAEPLAARVILKPRKAGPFFGRHPWVFKGAIAAIESDFDLHAGSAVELWSAEDRFIAHGLWNEQSNIHVRLYSWRQEVPIDDALLKERISAAVRLRRSLFDLSSTNTGCRLVFSEADGLSGLAVDFYGGFLLVQFTSQALFTRRDAIVAALTEELSPKGIWLRTEKGMREAEGLEASDGLIAGEEPPRPLFIQQHGISYGVDVQQGQKTGYYLDQRDNRQAAARYMAGRHIIDAFCFSGGFGITAAVNGNATSVLGIDSSEPALTLAAANAELNGVADCCRYQRGDVKVELASLAEQGKTFGGIILDPPRMARTRGGLNRALKGYAKLNAAAVDLLEPEGILVTCSCSGLVRRGDFRGMIADVSRQTGRFIQILEQHGHPPDHPIAATCPDSEYLKMLICRVAGPGHPGG